MCYNCGDRTHRWYKCTQPLKPALAAKKREWEQRVSQGKNNGNGYNGQSSFNNNGNNGQGNNNFNNGNNGHNGSNNFNFGNNGQGSNNFNNNNRMQQNHQQGFNNNRNQQVREVKLNIPEMKEVQLIEGIANCDVQIIDVANVDKTFNLIKSRKEHDEKIFCKFRGAWFEVEGKADTGACTTVCSMVHHQHVMIEKWEICGQNIVLRVADGTVHKVTHKCLLEVKINDTEIGIVESLAVNLEGWRNVLIGLDVLVQKGLVVNTKKC